MTAKLWLDHVHKFHHRVYVPYCFAALYNHPVETVIVDVIGASLGFMLSGLTTRQAMWFLVLSQLKSLDDHCGYALPFDPFRYVTALDTHFHDVHHQNWGMKVANYVHHASSLTRICADGPRQTLRRCTLGSGMMF